ncbi:MAG: alpha-isopropylmalate synthase regulatory domain-containing protein [Myxococcota bacterium]
MYSKQDEMLAKVRDILADDFLVLSISSYQLSEDFDSGVARLTCSVSNAVTEQTLFTVESEGTGIIDALFNGLKAKLAPQYSSLNSISFNDFSVQGIMSTSNAASGSDAEGQVELSVLSSEEHTFRFTATSRSISRASVEATLKAVGYFVNSERAFIQVYNILQHYRQESRTDLVTKYQLLLGQMVEISSYTEVIQQIKQKELNS